MGENARTGRGVGLDEACVHPPQYMANKMLLGVPPYFPNVQKTLVRCGLCLGPNCLPTVPPVPIGVCGGSGLSDPCG